MREPSTHDAFTVYPQIAVVAVCLRLVKVKVNKTRENSKKDFLLFWAVKILNIPPTPAWFSLSNFAKDTFSEVESVSLISTKCVNFSQFGFFVSSKKKPSHRAEKIFLRNNSLWYEFHSQLATLSIFDEIQVVFEEKTQSCTNFFLRIISILVAFYGKSATIWWLNSFASQNSRTLGILNIGHIQLKSKLEENFRVKWMKIHPFYNYGR